MPVSSMIIFALPTGIGGAKLIGELGFTDLNKLGCRCKKNIKSNRTANNFGSMYGIPELLCAARPNERERDDESHWVIHAVKRSIIRSFSCSYLKPSAQKADGYSFLGLVWAMSSYFRIHSCEVHHSSGLSAANP